MLISSWYQHEGASNKRSSHWGSRNFDQGFRTIFYHYFVPSSCNVSTLIRGVNILLVQGKLQLKKLKAYLNTPFVHYRKKKKKNPNKQQAFSFSFGYLLFFFFFRGTSLMTGSQRHMVVMA